MRRCLARASRPCHPTRPLDMSRRPARPSSRWCTSRARSFSSVTVTNDGGPAAPHAVHVRSALSAGPVPYERGWAWQHVLLERRLEYMRRMQRLARQEDVDEASCMMEAAGAHDDDRDWLLLFEHHPVYTLGRGASEDHLTFLDREPDGGAEQRRRLSRKYRGEDASRLNIDKSPRSNSQLGSVDEEVERLSRQSKSGTSPVCAPNGHPIYRIERGGEVTYHGPGQLVMYPLLHLHHPAYQKDLHWYLRQIEEVIIRTLHQFDIESNRDEINTGVWVGQNKIAAVGVSSARWITTHGLAINVHPNLEHFDEEIITPCGIEGRGVTSLADVLGGGKEGCPTVEEVAVVATGCFGEVFGIELTHGDPIR